jgi:DeoR/GlpR family transcriptional regulator of sugar metabolism
MAQKHTDSIVLVAIDRLNREPDEFGVRDLVRVCQMSDNTIRKSVKRHEQAGKLRVIRPGSGLRHTYVILQPPTEEDTKIAQLYGIGVGGGA